MPFYSKQMFDYVNVNLLVAKFPVNSKQWKI